MAIALAIAVQVLVSTIVGALLPPVALVPRQDPAVVAGPAVTTIVDVVGLLTYSFIKTSLLGKSLPSAVRRWTTC
jgi:magnesium transporter